MQPGCKGNNCSDFIQFSLYPVIESGYHANPFSHSGFGLKGAQALVRPGSNGPRSERITRGLP
jgi:hypothetical protein